MPLPWAPSKLVSDVDEWSFTNSANRAMTDLATMGERLMQPVTQQVRQVVEQAMPAPAPQPSPAPQPVVPSVPRFSLGKIEDWLTPAGPAQPAPQLAQPAPPSLPAPAPETKPPGMFSLPSLESFLGPSQTPSAPTAQPASPGAARPASPGAPAAPGDIEGYIRQAAQARGIDPNVAIKVVMAEGGVKDPVRQSDVVYQGRREQSYGPLQLNIQGGVGAAALKAGIDPRNPAHWQRAVDFGLDEVARSGWGQWHGAARVGVGPREGIGQPQTPAAAPAELRPSPATTGPPGVPTAVAEGAGWRERWGKDLTPNQIKETLGLGLSWDAALATCGIAASIAFARANGRTPTFKEALDLAQRTGEWNADVGMTRGTSGQLALLKGLGVEAQARPLAEADVARAVTSGQPVQINAHGNGGHFYVAQGYDPQTRKFDFGNSAAILKRSGGNTWYRLDELPSLGVGTPSEAIYLAGGR